MLNHAMVAVTIDSAENSRSTNGSSGSDAPRRPLKGGHISSEYTRDIVRLRMRRSNRPSDL